MGLIKAFRIKRCYTYGLASEGKYSNTFVKFENELGGEMSGSGNLMFVEDNIILGMIPLGEKIVALVNESEISGFENISMQPDGSAALKIIYKDGGFSLIKFIGVNKAKLLFLKKFEGISHKKDDIISEIEKVQ